MDEFSPASKPAFLDKALAESMPYVGADTTPEFDSELIGLPELQGEPLPPRGKGPTSGYEVRWDEMARMHAMGYTNNQIARHLGYSATGISLALNKPYVQERITHWRDRCVGEDAVTIMRDTSVYAARRLQRAVLDPDDKNGYDASKFITEKVTGKAKQEISVESGTFTDFMTMLKDMRSRNEVLDVTPEARSAEGIPAIGGDDAEPNRFDTWITANIG